MIKDQVCKYWKEDYKQASMSRGEFYTNYLVGSGLFFFNLKAAGVKIINRITSIHSCSKVFLVNIGVIASDECTHME